MAMQKRKKKEHFSPSKKKKKSNCPVQLETEILFIFGYHMCFGMSTNSVDCVQIRYKKQMISSLKTFYMSERFSIFSLYVANILSQNIMLLPTRGTLVMLAYTMPIWNFSVSCFWIILPWYPVRTLGTDFLIRPVLEVYRLNCCTPFVLPPCCWSEIYGVF